MKRLKLSLLFALALSLSISAQSRRYFDEVFPEVKVTADIVYGINATVLYLAPPPGGAGQAIPEQLKVDIYEPENDAAPARPLVIIMHTGNFLPPQVNGGCFGTRKDADNVAMAMRLAKMGYVAAVADYRLGWNPVASTQTERTYTLINAIYRGVQDSRTCVRFFNKDAATTNTFRIDPDKITLWGMGTGGYITIASATLDTISDTYIPKFIFPQGPMILEALNGNVDGTSIGINTNLPFFPIGDTLCYPNHVSYSSDFALSVNLSGALADTSWIEAGEIPIISFHNPVDPYAACGTSVIWIPPITYQVEVSGSCAFQPILNDVGNQNLMLNANLNDPLSLKARALNGNIEGFYPFLGTDPSPWAFSANSNPYGLATDPMCETMAAAHTAYIDTIMRYFAPRACAVLGLSPDCQLVSTNNLNPSQVGLSAIPNPSTGDFTIKADAQYVIQSIEMVDIAGRRVASFQNVNSNQYDVKRNNLAAGVYFAKVMFKEGMVIQKVILH